MDVSTQVSQHGSTPRGVSTSTAVLCGLITLIAGFLWLHQRRRARLLPPGPPVYLPVLGHLLLLANKPMQTFRALRHKYGDIFRIYLGSRLVVVINGYDAVNELLKIRGPEFSHRPVSYLAEKMAEFKGILNTSGAVWMEHRNNIMKTMRTLASRGGHLDLILETEVDKLCQKLDSLIKDGETSNLNLGTFVRKATCSVTFSMVYGRDLQYESKELKIYTEVLDELFKHFGMVAVLNFVPFMRHLPGDVVGYHRCLQLVKYLEEEVVKPEIQRITEDGYQGGIDSNANIQKPELAQGDFYSPRVSFASKYLEELYAKRQSHLATEMNEDQLVKVAGDMMAGGYESTSSTLLWLILYLVHHPDVQERCRKEVLEALNSSRGHVIDTNRSELVYTQATLMEVQRLANVAPLPPPRCSDHDTVVMGYTIPKNAMIMTNMDSLFMGEHVGEEPDKFRPERFIGSNGRLKHQKWFIPFAIGSRMCPGASVAKKELLAFAVGLLSRFKFRAPLVEGLATMPSLEGDLGITHVPKPFSVCIEPVA